MTTTELTPQPQHQGELRTATSSTLVALAILGLTVLSVGLVALDVQLPLVRLMAGIWLVAVLPVLLVVRKLSWHPKMPGIEKYLYSLALVVLALMLGGLALNAVLTHVGISRPLDRVPLLVALTAALTGLALWRRDRNVFTVWRLRLDRSSDPMRLNRIAGAFSVCLVFVSVIGAIRLNNGASGGVATVGLIGELLLLTTLMACNSRFSEAAKLWCLYFVSLALLLMTSLRGWHVTGHDIQREYRFFELTSRPGHWDIERFRDAYNACLSVNILPTFIQRMTGIPDLAVFKVLVQLVFAFCPLIVYLICRRFASSFTAMLGVVLFLAFPGFYSDLPFLIRQEIAYLFFGLAILAATDRRAGILWRRGMLIVLAIGVVFSHYSTTYVMIATLAVGWALVRLHDLVLVVSRRLARRSGRHRRGARPRAGEPVVCTALVLAIVSAACFTWVAVITRTGGEARSTFDATLTALSEWSRGSRASETATGLFAFQKPDPAERLKKYSDKALLDTTADRINKTTYPLSEVTKYQTPIVSTEMLPITGLGEIAEDLGVNVANMVALIHRGTAILLQLAICVGLAFVALKRALGIKPSTEFFMMAVAGASLLLVQTLLPELSARYGLLRTFQQELFLLTPFAAVGAVQLFRIFGYRAARACAIAATATCFGSLTGIIPQVFGGYPPQLHLNNAGQYFDWLYLHDEETSGMGWLADRLQGSKNAVQSEVITDRYMSYRMQLSSDLKPTDDIFPPLVQRSAYIFLGYATCVKGDVSIIYKGDVITYKFPVEFLDSNKSLLYSDGRVRIYR